MSIELLFNLTFVFLVIAYLLFIYRKLTSLTQLKVNEEDVRNEDSADNRFEDFTNYFQIVIITVIFVILAVLYLNEFMGWF